MKKRFLLFILLLIIPFITLAYDIGDVDGLNGVTTKDYLLIRKHLLNKNVLEDDQKTRADVNGDGVITAADYNVIRRIIMGTYIPTPTIIPTPTTTPTITPDPTISVNSVSLDKTSVIMAKGSTLNLLATIIPSNATNKNVKWSSSNSSVVTIDNNGKLAGINVGNAMITITSVDGNKSATCSIKIVDIKSFNSENDALVAYLASPSASNIKTLYNKYNCKDNACHKPKKYKTSLTGNINVYEYNQSNNIKTFIATVKDSNLDYYLVPTKTYYLESKNNINDVEIVKINGYVRMIGGSAGNFRDLGGWKADGGRIKYGIIFRSASSSGLKEATINSLKIGKIVDLRGTGEIGSVSEASSKIRKIISVTQYQINSSSKIRTAVTEIMKTVVNENKNVLFNCVLGRDRTGTVAFMLEGILGVSSSNRTIDYELTYFYKPDRTRTFGGFTGLVNLINKESKTNYDQERFINWYLGGSSDKNKDLKLINDFRKKMINGKPVEYILSGGKLKVA